MTAQECLNDIKEDYLTDLLTEAQAIVIACPMEADEAAHTFADHIFQATGGLWAPYADILSAYRFAALSHVAYEHDLSMLRKEPTVHMAWAPWFAHHMISTLCSLRPGGTTADELLYAGPAGAVQEMLEGR